MISWYLINICTAKMQCCQDMMQFLCCNQTLCSFLLVNCNWPNMYVCAEPMWHWQPIFLLNWYCNWIFLCHTTSWWLNFTKNSLDPFFSWTVFFSSEVSVYIILKQALFFLLLVAGYLPSYYCALSWGQHFFCFSCTFKQFCVLIYSYVVKQLTSIGSLMCSINSFPGPTVVI